MENTTQVELTTQKAGKTVLSIKEPTPTWAIWVFRAVFLLTTAATIIIAAEPAIDPTTKVRIGVYMKAFDFVIWGLAQCVGVRKDTLIPNEEKTEQ